LKKKYKKREDEEEGACSYWMTLRKTMIIYGELFWKKNYIPKPIQTTQLINTIRRKTHSGNNCFYSLQKLLQNTFQTS
jgi:hypothetical protein